MSIAVMSNVWRTCNQQGVSLLVMLALADWCDDAGECWPSLPQIATKARINVRGAIRILDRLEQEGEIERERGGGRGKTSRYRLPGYSPTENSVRETVSGKQCLRNTVPETVFVAAENSDSYRGDEVTSPPYPPYKELTIKEPSRGSRSQRKRAAQCAPAPDKPAHPRDDLFDAFCKAWAIDPDKPGRKASLAGDFAARCRRDGATVDDLRAFYAEKVAAGEWGRFIKPHTVTDEFLAWRRTSGRVKVRTTALAMADGRDGDALPLDPAGAPSGWRRIVYHQWEGQTRVRDPQLALEALGEDRYLDPARWPGWLVEVYRGTRYDPAR